MIPLATLALALALQQTPATAPPAPPPLWTSLPTAEDVASFYPKAALAKGVGGRAVLKCGVDPQGFLADCHLDNEYPTGQGFGAAALALQSMFRMKPVAGAPSYHKRSVLIPIRFEPPPHEPPPGEPTVKLAKPDWLSRPTAEQFSRYYPDKAIRQSISGLAVAQCVIAATGKLGDCKLIYEDPPGVGFGDATLKIMRFFEARTTASDGSSVVGMPVQVPIRFGTMGSP